MKWPVGVALGVVFCLGIFLGDFWNAHQLSNLRTGLNVAQGTVADLTSSLNAYKDKLNGASPDEAASKIAQLQISLQDANKELDQIFPKNKRKFSEEQKKFIRDHANDFKSVGGPSFIFSWYIGDSPLYAQDFADTFDAVGLHTLGIVTTVCDETQHGIMVGIPDVDHPSKQAAEFFSLLKQMKLSPQYTYWKTFPHPTPDFDLFICGSNPS